MSQTAVTTVSISPAAMSAARSATLILPLAAAAMLNPSSRSAGRMHPAEPSCSDRFARRWDYIGGSRNRVDRARSTRNGERPTRSCRPLACLVNPATDGLTDERHELIADKARLTRTGCRYRHPAINGWASDFQFDALAKDGNDLGVLHWLRTEIDINRGDDSGAGGQRRRCTDDRGASWLCDLRDGGFGLWLRSPRCSWLLDSR